MVRCEQIISLEVCNLVKTRGEVTVEWWLP